MNALNYLKMLLLCTLAMGLSSCGDDEDNGMDLKLCKTWVEEYITDDGMHCKHQLIFSIERNSGREVWEESKPGTTNTVSKDFTWQWRDPSMECLILSYGAGEVKYFENVWVRDHYLSGKLNGQIIMLVDAHYNK